MRSLFIVLLFSILIGSCQKEKLPLPAPFPISTTTILSDTSWHEVANLGDTTYSDIQFLTGSVGWICGNSGSIQKTINGGITWTPQSVGVTDAFISMSFINVNEGWLMGINGGTGNVYRTTDGGASWNLLSSDGTRSNSIFFTDSNNGWRVGSSILVTTDGGITWTSQISPSTATWRDIYMLNSSVGIICGQSFIIQTTDGGINWNEVYNAGSGSFLKIDFDPNSTTGYASGASVGVTKSTDNGTTWITTSSGKSPQYVSSASGNMAVTIPVGLPGFPIHTVDGGSIWTPEDTPQIIGGAVDMLSDTSGFIVTRVSSGSRIFSYGY